MQHWLFSILFHKNLNDRANSKYKCITVLTIILLGIVRLRFAMVTNLRIFFRLVDATLTIFYLIKINLNEKQIHPEFNILWWKTSGGTYLCVLVPVFSCIHSSFTNILDFYSQALSSMVWMAIMETYGQRNIPNKTL